MLGIQYVSIFFLWETAFHMGCHLDWKEEKGFDPYKNKVFVRTRRLKMALSFHTNSHTSYPKSP